MFPRALLAAVVLAAPLASAQTGYDLDYDGDVDADDWFPSPPPLPTSEDTGWAAYPGEQPPPVAPTQTQLEQQVAAYGTFVEEPGVGRVWQPAQAVVGADFVPYTTGGQWVATTAGWQFASTYRFGSTPFHYGRWYQSPRYGWVWWPQTQWAPAWVDWRCNTAGNVAWAPVAPPGVSVGFRVGNPGWSYAYGRYSRPSMKSFSWGRYGGWNGGWRGWHGGGGRRSWRSHDAAPVYRGGGYRGGGWGGGRNWDRGGGRGGGRRRW